MVNYFIPSCIVIGVAIYFADAIRKLIINSKVSVQNETRTLFVKDTTLIEYGLLDEGKDYCDCKFENYNYPHEYELKFDFTDFEGNNTYPITQIIHLRCTRCNTLQNLYIAYKNISYLDFIRYIFKHEDT